jgi:hypothetical protein
MVTYIKQYDRGSGLSPGPDPAPIITQPKLIYISIHIYNKEQTVVRWSGGLCEGFTWWGGPGFEPHELQYILIKQPIYRCHVAAHDWATWNQTTNHILPHVETLFDHNCQSTTATSPHATSTYGRTTLPRHPVRTVQLASLFFCLFDIPNRLRYLSLPTSV